MAWPDNQERRVALVVQNAQVSGSGTHSDFPVLLTADNLPDEVLDTGDANAPQSDGGDIRFASDEDGETQLPFEIVDFSPTSGGAGATAQIWVKVDLDTASDTTFYMAWKTADTISAPAVTDANGRNAVWSDYERVYHLSEAAGSFVDSTGSGSDGTLDGTVTRETAVGNLTGIDLGAPNHTNFVDADSLGSVVNQSCTAQFWGDFDSTASQPSNAGIFGDGDVSGTEGFTVRRNGSGNDLRVWVDSETSYRDNTGGFSGLAGVGAVLAHITYDSVNTQTEVFADGSSIATDETPTIFDDPASSPTLKIGVQHTAFAGVGGAIAEFRIRFSILSDDWITTEFNNQNAPATFVTAGAVATIVAALTMTDTDTIQLPVDFQLAGRPDLRALDAGSLPRALRKQIFRL